MEYGSLKIKFPNGQTREFKLEHPTIFIGQAEGNELVLEDRSVSRRHARFSVESGKLAVEDLGSSNGTLVGGQRLAPNQPSPVSKNQVVRLGQVEIQYIPPDDDDNLNLSLLPGPGPGAFQVVLENQGNDIKAYALRGGDDLLLLDFKFSPETVTLQPRQKRAIPLQVTLKSKSGTNPTGIYPFRVMATAMDQSRTESKTSGQLIARRGQSQGRKLTLAISLAGVMAIIALFLFGGSAAAYFVLCPTYFPNLPFCSRPKPVASLTPTVTPSATPMERTTQTPTPPPTKITRPTRPPVTVVVGSPTPPSKDAISLNCDDTYQRLRSDLGSATGDQIWVDRWDGQIWVNAWNYAAGDPQVQHIEPEVGFYAFGACQKLLVAPVRVTGSGAILDLSVYVWDGKTMALALFKEGVHGTWFQQNETLTFEESVYLYNEPNCCPCNRQFTHEVWDGAAFIQMDQHTEPTYSGTPPPECQSSSIPR